MKIDNRQRLLALAAIAVVGLFAADKVLLTPLTHFWKDRAARIAELRKQVEDGRQLLQREQVLRRRWETMRTNTLPINPPLAEQQVLKAFDRWWQESRVSITGINSQWRRDTDDFMTLECRVDASGNLAALSQFLYYIEKDPMALKLETVDVSARDNEGQQLTLGLQISGLVLTPQTQSP